MKEHQGGQSRATRHLRPLELRLFYPVKILSEARSLEHGLKRAKNRKLINQIIIDQDIKMDA